MYIKVYMIKDVCVYDKIYQNNEPIIVFLTIMTT